ncbi:MAG: hypothetical protein H7322_01280 [Ramlibacter sp.]|nr:hypothetical protein [Ramlibacter sp.]
MVRAIRLLLVLLAGVVLAGCASVSGGNVQKMYVQAQSQNGAAVSGADCTLTNDKGSWRLTAPGDTSIVRSNKRMEVKCDKSPLPPGVVSVESATRGAMYGNIILGGVVGAVIDHNSGAAYEYPEMIKVIMGRMVSMDVPKQPVSGTRDPNIPKDTRAASARPTPTQPPGQAIAAADPVPSAAAGIAPIAPIATGYARIDDIDAVPYLGDKGREGYRLWIKRPTPKAFAVSTDGSWFGAWGLRPADPAHPTDPSERAMLLCQQRTKGICMLYAVNGSVVWAKPTPVAASPAARGHSHTVPPASGYAAIDNVDAVPARAEGKARYSQYLAMPSPKAFVVYETGGWQPAVAARDRIHPDRDQRP